jgi:hypothetical protein
MRLLLSAVVGAALCLTPAAVSTAQEQTSGAWAVTMARTTPYASMTDDAEALPDLPPLTLLQVLRYEGDWAFALNPRTREEMYVPSDVLGPSDPPSRYLTMAPPPVFEEFSTRGVVTDSTALAMFPTPAEEASQRTLNPNTWLVLTGILFGEDGQLWYRTQDDHYITAEALFVPERTADFAGRWLDVDLNAPAHVTLLEGGEELDSFPAIKGTGRWPTPTGAFTILRRVANETMNSESIGIPRFSPGGYYLTNVLFTQYFTGDGASLHYNYWSGNFGYAGSHGCLGLTYADSAYLWEWARIGTPVLIHY